MRKGDKNRRRYRGWRMWRKEEVSRVTMTVVTETDARGDSHCRGQLLPVSRSGVGGIAPAAKGRLGPFEHMMGIDLMVS
jgi:hypothetical protein